MDDGRMVKTMHGVWNDGGDEQERQTKEGMAR
jgi:hypothetical protein